MSIHAHRTLFLTGDVMTGRGIDQILPHGGDPTLREAVVTDARTYVRLAEEVNGPIPAPADFAWPWGDALGVLDEFAPDIRLLNVETSITTAGDFFPGKAVHYRMHPDNIACLGAVRPDVCALANNHVLDFGYRGLADTLQALSQTGIRAAGAGLDAAQAEQVVVLGDNDGAVVGAVGSPSSGIPRRWAAEAGRPGVALIADLSDRTADVVARRILAAKRPGDTAIVSVHWGSNWGYDVDRSQVRLAHRLIDSGIDVVHGHSSHHPRPVEIYQGKLILYGCGDTIDDYEGIGGYESFRHELRLLYFASVERGTGRLVALRMMPMRMRKMRLEHVSSDEAEWLRATLERISRPFGTRVRADPGGCLLVDE